MVAPGDGGAPPLRWAAATAQDGLTLAITTAAAALLVLLLLWRRRSAAPAPPRLPFPVISDGTWKAAFAAQREDAFLTTVCAEPTRTVVLGATVATADPAAVRALLLSRPHSLGRSWVYRALARFMPSSDGILFMEGEPWRRRHSAFTPLLTGGNVRRFSLAMFQSSLEALAAYAGAGGGAGGPAAAAAAGSARAGGWDLLTAVREGAAAALLRFALGVDPSTPAARALEADMDLYARTAFEVFPFVGPARQVAAYATLWAAARRIGAGVRRIVADPPAWQRDFSNAAFIAAGGAGGGELGGAGAAAQQSVPHSLLARMLAPGATGGKGAEFTPEEVASEVNHLHGAHKAVALVTTCGLAELSLPNPPAVAARAALLAEFVAVCGRPTPQALAAARKEGLGGLLAQAAAGHAAFARHAESQPAGGFLPPAALPHGWRPPDRSDLECGRLPVLSRVWRETLRHHVVSMGVLRRTAREGEEQQPADIHGTPLPPGSDVVLLLHALHHDPALWGPNAHVWDPQRWAAIDAAREQRVGGGGGGGGAPTLPDPAQPLPFYPFLEGVRRCAGMHLAELQAAVILYVWLAIGDVGVAGAPEAEGPAAPQPGGEHTRAPGWAPMEAAGDPTRHRVALARVRAPAGGGGSGPPTYVKLVKRADMFTSLDGALPFRVAAWG